MDENVGFANTCRWKKGPNDILVLVTSYNEPLTFAEWLFIGKCYLDSEASYYPIEEGYIGKAMLMNALNEIALGVCARA